MNFSENLENARNFAVNAAQVAAQKAKVLAAIAKAIYDTRAALA